jgi:NADH-quinone oxidoreductase subunit A
MQSDQLNYIPILIHLSSWFVVGTILVSGKLGPKDLQKIKTKTLSLV